MVQKLNNIFWRAKHSRSSFQSAFFINFLCLTLALSGFCQQGNPNLTNTPEYKNEGFYHNIKKREEIASAQINALKNGGALLVRLKTNLTLINKMRAAGNTKEADKIEKVTRLSNKIIVGSYLQELTFCPVYFFYSDKSDSVRNKKLTGILVDTNLNVNPSIICDATFYLVSESGQVYNSSIGIVSELEAPIAKEKGAASSEADIIIKNRYFIQLYNPFPFFQFERSSKTPLVQSKKGQSFNLDVLHEQIKTLLENSWDAKRLIGLKGSIRAINERLFYFYQKNKGYIMPKDLMQFVY